MCSKPKPPKAPDYIGIAKQQGNENLNAAIATAQLSNPNMNTPYGNRSVTYDGNIPTVTDTLSDVGQQQFDSQNRIVNNLNNTAESGLNRVSDAMATPFDMSKVQGYSGAPGMTVDPSKLSGRTVNPGVASYDDPIVKALIERNKSYQDQQRSGTESDLLARGFNPGGSGYDSRIGQLGQQENDYRLAALLAGGQEQSRVAGLESQIRAQGLGEQQAVGADQSRVMGAESSRRGQDIQEQAYLRNLPLSELNALRTGGQPGMPQFQAYQGANIAAAPLMDATMAQGNFAQQNYQNQIAAGNPLMDGLFGLAGAGLGAAGAAGGVAPLFAGLSDRRLKENIKLLWKSGKFNIYSFNYTFDKFECIGVMADEIETIMPEAVLTLPSGYKAVNYGML